jgi:hypothetical protein
MGLFSMFSGLFGSGGKSAKARILCVSARTLTWRAKSGAPIEAMAGH